MDTTMLGSLLICHQKVSIVILPANVKLDRRQSAVVQSLSLHGHNGEPTVYTAIGSRAGLIEGT
jgi:hypothetical protein